jgi:hypothetical protein
MCINIDDRQILDAQFRAVKHGATDTAARCEDGKAPQGGSHDDTDR